MKNFLIGLVIAVVFILPNIVQADTLDDFKNILASKHFLIKYSVQFDLEDYNSNKRAVGDFYKDKDGVHVTSGSFNGISKFTIGQLEVYDGNNFYVEENIKINGELPKQIKQSMKDAEKMNPASCQLKIGNKLFKLRKMDGKYFSAFDSKTNLPYDYLTKYAIYQEVDENIKIEQSQLDKIIAPLFNKDSNIDLKKYVYSRAGSGTDEDGFEYFDLKADTGNTGALNAIRYYFKGGVIKKVALAVYYKDAQSGKGRGSHEIIDVEEFNTNPDPKYFKLPNNFKWQKSAAEIVRS